MASRKSAEAEAAFYAAHAWACENRQATCALVTGLFVVGTRHEVSPCPRDREPASSRSGHAQGLARILHQPSLSPAGLPIRSGRPHSGYPLHRGTVRLVKPELVDQ